MWTKPWTFKEGFLMGGGLIFAGLALQLSVGPVVWDAFVWPANGIVLAGFMVMLTAMVYLRKKVYAFQWMRTATRKALWAYLALAVFASLFAYFFFDSYNTKTLVPAL